MVEPLPGVPSPDSTPRPLLVNQARAAKALDLSERTVYELRRRGILAGVKVGGAVRYRWAELEAFAAGNGAALDSGERGGGA